MRNVVILIHGTFARDALWTQDESNLALAVNSISTANVSTEKFLWSGQNSFADRLEATVNLVQRMREITLHQDALRIHLVAHSHGGNIALSAASKFEKLGIIRSVSTLGTPFLSLEEKKWASPMSLSTTLTFFLAAIYVFTALASPTLIMPAALSLAILLGVWVGTYIICHRAAVRARETIRKHGVHDHSRLDSIRFLCIRYRFDEAGLWLALLSIFRVAERLLYKLFLFFTGTGAWLRVAAFLFIALCISVGFTMIGLHAFPAIDLLLVVVLFIALVLPMFSIIGTMLSSHRFGLAGRMSLQALFIDVRLNVRPQVRDVVDELHSPTLGLVRVKAAGTAGLPTPHSFGYLDPVAVAKVRDFIGRNANA